MTLTDTPAAGAAFASWSEDCAGTNPTCTLSMTQDRVAKANFLPGQLLTVQKYAETRGLGTVTSSPARLDCGPTCQGSQGSFVRNSNVTLTGECLKFGVRAGESLRESPPMTSKKKKTDSAQKPALPKELLDQLLGAVSEQVQSGGLAAILKELTGAVVNRALEAELTAHLDYEDGEQPPEHQTNRRNGHRKKKLRTDLGEVEIKVPRDREGSFEPQLIRPYQRAVPGFEQKILSMYARGLSDREISSHFAEIYGIDVGHDLISRVTDAVLGEMREWRDRPLQIRYPIVYLDALVVKVRDSGCVRNKSLYLVIGIDDEGRRDVLGMWLQDTEGAKFWLTVLTELRNRGVQDILFLCADGLAGLPEAVEVAFPETVFQTCVVHLIRSSTRLVPWKDKTAVCRDLKPIYTAPSIDAAEQALDAFEETWGKKYPSVGKAWRTRFAEWSPFLAFSPAIRKAIYTTNAIEATNRQLRKVLKTKGHLPSDLAVYKLVYLVLQTTDKNWRRQRSAADWKNVAAELHLRFNERFPLTEISP